jgi:hypothetical protein
MPNKTNARHRLQRLAHNGAGEAQYPIGRANDSGVVTSIRPRHNGGLVLSRGTVKIMFTPEEALELIELARELTAKHSGAVSPSKARLVAYPVAAKS